MIHIKRYKAFFEDNGYDSVATDPDNVVEAKKKMEDLKKQLTDYNSKKSSIDKIYKNEDDTKLVEELDRLLGPVDKGRNPFLVSYAHVTKLGRDIEKLKKSNIDDKIKMDDFKSDLIGADPAQRTKINDKIQEINNRMSDRLKKISDKEKEISDSDKAHDEKMKKLDTDIKGYMDKISEGSK